MPVTSYTRELAIAREAVTTAARLCRNVRSSLDPTVHEKEDRSPVTIADFGSQAVVCHALRQAFPDDAIVAEEDAGVLRRPGQQGLCADVTAQVARVQPGEAASEDDVCTWIDAGNAQGGHERFWTLDPIDGTKGFLRGDQYAVALALVEDDRVQVGVLACPNLNPSAPNADAPQGSLLYAVRGEGAYQVVLAGSDDATDATEEPSRLKVSTTSMASEARLTESVESRHSSHGEAAALAEHLEMQSEPLRLDSQVKYAVVARGEAEIYLRLLTDPSYREKVWDHAAGSLVVAEAGGRVTDRRGHPLDFVRDVPHVGPHEDVVVTNGRMHDAVLQGLRQTAGASR